MNIYTRSFEQAGRSSPLTGPDAPDAFTSPGSLRLMVRNGERNWTGGPITVLVWETQAGFPWTRKLARRVGQIDPAAGQRSVVFMGLSPGLVAVTAYAGGDRLGLIPKILFGMPTQPLFLAKGGPSLAGLRFSDHAIPLRESTIIELKLARAERPVAQYRDGKKHDSRASEPRSHETAARTGHRSSQASGRR